MPKFIYFSFKKEKILFACDSPINANQCHKAKDKLTHKSEERKIDEKYGRDEK